MASGDCVRDFATGCGTDGGEMEVIARLWLGQPREGDGLPCGRWVRS